MIILLTPTMLANDIVTTARYKMARMLGVPARVLTAKWFQQETGGLGVEFEVVPNSPLRLSEEAVKAVIQTIWNREYKRKLEWTLQNVKSVRQ